MNEVSKTSGISNPKQMYLIGIKETPFSWLRKKQKLIIYTEPFGMFQMLNFQKGIFI
jgi:hypothetical protein